VEDCGLDRGSLALEVLRIGNLPFPGYRANTGEDSLGDLATALVDRTHKIPMAVISPHFHQPGSTTHG
jgi:hypothetical protein